MVDTVIIFSHYKTNLATATSLKMLRVLHPKMPVIPVSVGELFSDSVRVDRAEFLTEKLRQGFVTPWRYADLFLYAGYEHAIKKYPEAKRFILYEWDTHLNGMVLQDALDSWWDCACAVPKTQKYPADRDWYWFHEMHTLPLMLRKCAMGCNSLAIMLFSADALKKLVDSVKNFETLTCFCELRVGTLLNHCGIAVADMALPGIRHTPEWGRAELAEAESGIYHPIKSCPMLP